MSNKFKLPEQTIKASRDMVAQQESNIAISLQYLTSNKGYNFSYFGNNLRDKLKFLECFLEFLQRLTSKTRLNISGLRKENDCGYEHMPFNQIDFQPNNIVLGKDTNIFVFRLGNGDSYRVLGFFTKESPVFNIIGFDFDYSSYKHS